MILAAKNYVHYTPFVHHVASFKPVIEFRSNDPEDREREPMFHVKTLCGIEFSVDEIHWTASHHFVDCPDCVLKED